MMHGINGVAVLVHDIAIMVAIVRSDADLAIDMIPLSVASFAVTAAVAVAVAVTATVTAIIHW